MEDIARLAHTSKGIWNLTEESVKEKRQLAGAGGAKLCCEGPHDNKQEEKAKKRCLIRAAIFDLDGVIVDSEREVPKRHNEPAAPTLFFVHFNVQSWNAQMTMSKIAAGMSCDCRNAQ